MRFAYVATGAVALVSLTAFAQGAAFQIYFGAVFDPNQVPASLTPSSGSFVTQEAVPGFEGTALAASGGALGGAFRVRVDGGAWNAEFESTMASTWLTIDRWGPKGTDGTAAYGRGWFDTVSGPAGTVAVPEANSSLGGPGLAINGNNGDPVDGDGLSPGFYATSAGFLWDRGPGVITPAEPSVINGVSQRSIFLGHFVLSDPNATLVGNDLFVLFSSLSPGFTDNENVLVPLDGSHATLYDTGATIPYWLEYERVTFTNSLGTFTALDMYLVPAPSSAGALLGMLAIVRRRRRE